MRGSSSRAGWSFAPHRRSAAITDILRREFETRTNDEPEAMYDSRPVSALHDALDRALALDEASKAAVRPTIGNPDVAELLRSQLGTRDDASEAESDD